MAGVVNPLNGLAANRSDSGNVIPPESPDTVILSPTIKEAMDRILPMSATQLLQPGLSCDQTSYTQSTSEKVSNMLPNLVDPDALSPSKTPGFITPSCEKKPDHQTDSHFNSLNGSSNDGAKKIGKIRISKADLEVMTSAGDLVINDFSTETDSDPEDMTRCFKKRKHKKKKKSTKNSPERECAIPQITASEDDTSSTVVQKLVPESNVKGLTQPLGSRNNELQSTLPVSEASSRLHNSVQNDIRKSINDSQKRIGNALPKNGFSGDCALGNEDVSNISTSSSKENVLSQRKHSGQALPRTKRLEYNIIRHKGKIKNTFLPCFIVLNKCDSSQKFSNSCFDLSGSELPLSTRVKYLLDMCSKGKVDCKKRKQKGVIIVDRPVYKNIFEENVLPGISDDEFEYSRRSLRKRVKNISYVEPTEDDILDEFTKKRSRSKAKESGSGHDTDTSQETKKKRTSDKSDEHIKKPEKIAEKEKVERRVETMTYTKKGNRDNEIIVFPRAPIAKEVLNSHKTSGNTEKKPRSKNVSKRSDPRLPFDFNISSPPPLVANSPYVAAPPRISLFPGPPRPTLFSPSAVSAPVFSLHTPSYPTAITAISTTPNLSSIATLPSQMVRAAQHMPVQKHPQYCFVKVDGKDVLLQLVPSSAGASVLLPGGKRLLVEPPLSAPLLSPPLRSTAPISTQAVTVPVCAAQVPTVSSGMFPFFGLPLANRCVNSTTSNIPLPVISFASGGGFSTPSTPFTTRTTLTSATQLAQPSVPFKTTTPIVTIVPSSVTVTTSVARNTISTSAVSSSIMTPMGAPALKPLRATVADQVRPVIVQPDQVGTLVSSGLRAVVPNQTSSLRSIRIFVPGCTSTGTPGRFATLGSIASSSPLTRLSASSDLLPQRKHSHDHELTPEQKAAKRRKLEKKYPLPPGVVIKTEPLESLPPPTVTTAVRSLLSPNIQLLSSVARPGTTVRIIVPSVANALSSGIRGNQNIIYRASSGGSQTVLTTLGNLTSVVSSVPSSSAAIVSSVSNTALATVASPSTTPLDMSKQTHTLGFNSPSSSASTLSSQSPAIWSPASSLSDQSTKISGTTIVCSSAPLTSSVEKSTVEKTLTAESLEEFKISLVKLRELVTKQESLGLKGERLDKLRVILLKKEIEFKNMEKQLEAELNSSASEAYSELNSSAAVTHRELNSSAHASEVSEVNSSAHGSQGTLTASADISEMDTNSPDGMSESLNTVNSTESLAAAVNDPQGTEDEPFIID